MKPFFIVLLAADFALPATAQTSPVLYPALSKTLDSLAFVDQRPMQEMMRGQTADSTKKRLVAEQYVNFARHQPVLEAIVKKCGYPGTKQVGETSAKNFFLLVQHADAYPVFQEKILKIMSAEVQRKNADNRSFAYLTDRVALNRGQPQTYCSQVEYKADGQPTPRNLLDPANVDKRRASIGMEPLEAYLAKIREMQQQSRQPKQK
ncbi:DUF6624 domain-containing protein [Hymenobacter nivis]|uniref:Uncharacterized protein n=1 Tax=Hymenobacter nivis TaxID=1850093 RepID=A0A2Z3GXM4_9BACT|nr:DUF6624 domain-containing protein [Hymenobacter nivis]AWM33490.1 hypothetical protein DDQ68_12250 [Hymenobacter nivis]